MRKLTPQTTLLDKIETENSTYKPSTTTSTSLPQFLNSNEKALFLNDQQTTITSNNIETNNKKQPVKKKRKVDTTLKDVQQIQQGMNKDLWVKRNKYATHLNCFYKYQQEAADRGDTSIGHDDSSYTRVCDSLLSQYSPGYVTSLLTGLRHK